MNMLRWPFLAAFLLLAGHAAQALEPKEVFLLVNKTEPESLKIAEYYCGLRKVPKENIIVLEVTTDDDVSRTDYDLKIAGPVREALRGKELRVKCLLSIYGMPLRVGAPTANAEQQAKLKPLEAELKTQQAKLATIKEQMAKNPKETTGGKIENISAKTAAELEKAVASTTAKMNTLFSPPKEAMAAVDSELMLLMWDKYDLNRFVINPLHWKFPESKRKGMKPVLMTSRIDGPTAEIARRIIKDAVEAEEKGLQGKVYVDARGIPAGMKSESGWGYEGYDESYREMAALLKDAGKMDVTLDDKETLFPEHSCRDCAIYSGWYSVSKFVDCCDFVPGAVAWHLASYEAITLKKETTGWCKNQLLKGATVTLGSVAEPYTAGFPKPAEFFGFLATGKYTLVECYSRTMLLTSWMTVLVGDPLYNPYKKAPKLKEADVELSPKWGKYLMTVED